MLLNLIIHQMDFIGFVKNVITWVILVRKHPINERFAKYLVAVSDIGQIQVYFQRVFHPLVEVHDVQEPRIVGIRDFIECGLFQIWCKNPG